MLLWDLVLSNDNAILYAQKLIFAKPGYSVGNKQENEKESDFYNKCSFPSGVIDIYGRYIVCKVYCTMYTVNHV